VHGSVIAIGRDYIKMRNTQMVNQLLKGPQIRNSAYSRAAMSNRKYFCQTAFVLFCAVATIRQPESLTLKTSQVATDTRMWLRSNIEVLKEEILALVEGLMNRAEAEIDVLLPGYTHMQRAQPIR